MATLTSSAPAAYAALSNLLDTACTAAGVPFFTSEILQNQPPAYIFLEALDNHSFTIEGMEYTYTESYDITGSCRYVAGDVGGNTYINIMNETYTLFTTIVMQTVVENRGGNGVAVLGITSYPSPFEIKAGFARYQAIPGNFGGGQAGWQGVLDWSFSLRAYIAPQ